MELSDCPDCHDLAEALRKHVKMVDDARRYVTDAHAGEVRQITPLEALRELTVYYEDMMEDQDEAINNYETDIKNLEFLLTGTESNYKEARKQIELQLKYITELKDRMEKDNV